MRDANQAPMQSPAPLTRAQQHSIAGIALHQCGRVAEFPPSRTDDVAIPRGGVQHSQPRQLGSAERALGKGTSTASAGFLTPTAALNNVNFGKILSSDESRILQGALKFVF